MRAIVLQIVLFYFSNSWAKGLLDLEKYRSDVLKMANGIPFNVELKLDNQMVNESDFNYYLFTRKNPDGNQSLVGSLSALNPRLPIKFLVHGWTEHCDVQWCKDITAAYLKKGNYNVIIGDWAKFGDADYVSASNHVSAVGNAFGDFLIDLHEKKKIPYKNMHLVSHSLGCHVASFMGKRVYNVTGKKLARITALDPAAPIFEMVTEDQRLNKNDALFVDIMHTDGGLLGFKAPIGTVDFYPNGGIAVQPGCSLLKPDVKYEDLFCGHARSHKYFEKTIYSGKAMATSCSSWDSFKSGKCLGSKSIKFGDGAPSKVSGMYFLNFEIKTPI